VQRSGVTSPRLLRAVGAALVLMTARPAAASEQELLRAVRAGDLAAVKALLDKGVPVDAKFRYDRTALSFAADRGHAEIVKLLLDRGANVNAEDTFYKVTPLFWAADHSHVEVVRILLARGATGEDSVLRAGLDNRNPDLARAALGTGKLDKDELASALEQADKAGLAEIAALLREAGVVLPPKGDFKVDASALARYVGTYQEAEGDRQTLTVTLAEGALHATVGGPPLKLGAIDALTFRPVTIPRFMTLTFKTEGTRVSGVTAKDGRQVEWFARVAAQP
jgi:hypothetical protein